MLSVGIICEFNPLHNGHIHFINEVKKKYPDYTLILALGGYFLQRGEASILSKEDKVRLSLEYGMDIVVEIPVIYATQSADNFAYGSVSVLKNLCVDEIVFGSEANDITILENYAKMQEDDEFFKKVKKNMSGGISYPKALGKALEKDNFLPNDILGIAYIKAILKNNYNIKYDCIKRTNSFHDLENDTNIVSASNIRKKLNEKKEILKYIPSDYTNLFNNCDKQNFYNILRVIILSQKNLSQFLDVDEGIENRLYEYALISDDYEEFFKNIKTKRYTYNKLNRMFIHIMLGITKKDANEKITYSKILGFNETGKEYLNIYKNDILTKIDKTSKNFEMELKSSVIYEIIMKKNLNNFDKSCKPLKII